MELIPIGYGEFLWSTSDSTWNSDGEILAKLLRVWPKFHAQCIPVAKKGHVTTQEHESDPKEGQMNVPGRRRLHPH